MNQETANYIMLRMDSWKRVHRNFWICSLQQSGLREDEDVKNCLEYRNVQCFLLPYHIGFELL